MGSRTTVLIPEAVTTRSGITRTVTLLPIGAVVNRPPKVKEMAKPVNKAAGRPSTK